MDIPGNNDHITETDILLSRYISGEASDAERKQAEQWISQAYENRLYAESLQQIWNTTGNMAYKGIKKEDTAWKALENRIDTHSQGVVRSMSKGIYKWMTVAATVIILLGLFFLIRPGGRKVPGNVMMIHSNSGAAERTDTLPDGTVVILQPHSVLSYPSVFTSDKRQVELSGSGFFKVYHDASKPFKVNVGDIIITVLGTSFDITSSPGQISIAVKTGIVEVTRMQQKMQLYVNEKLVITSIGTNWIKQPDTVINPTALRNGETAPGKNLPPLTSSSRPMHAMLVGDKMPILYIDKWIKGEQVNIFEKGKAYLVNFWGLSDGPSIKILEHLSELQKKYKNDGLVVISATSEDDLGNSYEKVSDFIKSKGNKSDHHFAWLPVSYNAGVTSRSIRYNTWLIQAYDSSFFSLPQVFLVDKNGNFAFIGDGNALTESYIGKVLKGKHDLTEERRKYIEILRTE